LDFVLKHPLLKDNPIVVYGQSLGGAVAIHIAATNQSKVSFFINNSIKLY
jgi:surfactin synthase thioesterase subunit